MPEEDVPPQSKRSEDETRLLTPPTSAVSIRPAAPAPLREVIGDFEVQEKLGAGGMGAVYRARQLSLGRMVALKILPTQFIEDAESVSRFQREARVAASLSHANLVRVYSAGEADGCHFIAMELIEGEDLGRRLKRDGRLPAPEALRICAEVARGLDHAWRTAHLIHRDIKPANIFLADRDIDFRADIYSLGCTLYHLLTGQVPYGGTEAITILRRPAIGTLLLPRRPVGASPRMPWACSTSSETLGEWCEDICQPDKPARVLRGSSFVCFNRANNLLTSSRRHIAGTRTSQVTFGFRVVPAPAP